jgi:hypothetical protein
MCDLRAHTSLLTSHNRGLQFSLQALCLSLPLTQPAAKLCHASSCVHVVTVPVLPCIFHCCCCCCCWVSRRDFKERPELHSGTVEWVAPQEYMVGSCRMSLLACACMSIKYCTTLTLCGMGFGSSCGSVVCHVVLLPGVSQCTPIQ